MTSLPVRWGMEDSKKWGGILVKGETPLWTMLFERSMKKSLHCFLLITIPIYTMPICNNKYIFGSELQNSSNSISNGYFLDIMSNSLWHQFFHTISPSSSKCFLCVKNLAQTYKMGIIGRLSLSKKESLIFTTVSMSVCKHVFSKTTHGIFQKLLKKLAYLKAKKLTAKFFGKKSHFGDNTQKHPKNSFCFGFCKYHNDFCDSVKTACLGKIQFLS